MENRTCVAAQTVMRQRIYVFYLLADSFFHANLLNVYPEIRVGVYIGARVFQEKNVLSEGAQKLGAKREWSRE